MSPLKISLYEQTGDVMLFVSGNDVEKPDEYDCDVSIWRPQTQSIMTPSVAYLKSSAPVEHGEQPRFLSWYIYFTIRCNSSNSKGKIIAKFYEKWSISWVRLALKSKQGQSTKQINYWELVQDLLVDKKAREEFFRNLKRIKASWRVDFNEQWTNYVKSNMEDGGGYGRSQVSKQWLHM